jgi:3-oxoacyl-[acyl-carrier-protein] synthase II
LKRKVLITGCDTITALGLGVNETWNNMLEGQSGVGLITRFDTETLETKIAAQVPDTFDSIVGQYCKRRNEKKMTFVTKMAFISACKAICASGIDFANCDRSRCGVILGIVNAGYTSVEQQRGTNDRIVKAMNNAPSAWISMEYGLEGPNFPIATACASSAYAMAFAYELIANNQADVIITGGADSTVCPEEIQGFNEILALSTRNEKPQKACRPFTKSRDGFVIGEGAGIMVFESEEHAKKRSAEIIAEMGGYALTSEAYNIVSPRPEGVGMANTMERALIHAGVNKEDVDYVNAHGTSTLLNDKYETEAIKKVFDQHAYKLAVSSTKSLIGHTIGAAGAIEGITTILSLKNNKLTPTINYDDPDPELDLDYVPNISRDKVLNIALLNSFGFGGHNATLVFKKYNR